MSDITPGIKADATIVRDRARAMFSGDNKAMARAEAIQHLSNCGVTRPLDLWGGGLSAEAMVKAGMRPLSIDDGRLAPAIGVTKKRYDRAVVVSGLLGGYDTGLGRVQTYASMADGAFLDFCGHWSPAVRRALTACRHMEAIAVTLMPERAPLGSLSLEDWLVAYLALIKNATRMSLPSYNSYVRNGTGQSALVFFLSRVPAKDPRYNKLYRLRPDRMEEDRRRSLAYRARPEVAARLRAQRSSPEYREHARAYRAKRRADGSRPEWERQYRAAKHV